MWPFEFAPRNGARLKGTGLEFTSRGMSNACAGRPLFPSGELTVEFAAVPGERPMDSTGVLLSFYDSAGKPVLSVTQWSDSVIISSGENIRAGVRSALAINRNAVVAVSVGKKGIRLFVDGKASGGSSKPFYGLEKAACFTLGNSPVGKQPWKGRLHRLALWTRALSDGEARESFEAASAGTKPAIEGLAGFYVFEGRGRLVRNAVSGELDISVPEKFSPVKKVFLGPLFEDGGRFRLDAVDAAVNFIGFMPLGLLAFFLRSPAARDAAKLLFALSAGFALSFSIEAAQVFMPDRFSQLSDLLLNATGAFAGALIAMFLRKMKTLRRLID